MLVQFKKASLDSKNVSGKIMASSGPFLAYILNERKIRILNILTGQKCSIDRVQGSFVSLAWSDKHGQVGTSILAVLAEDGEVTLGRITPEEADNGKLGLSFEVTSILSFPEVGRARGMSWSSGDSTSKRYLAIFGHSSSEVFFVHYSPNGLNTIKSSFLSSAMSDIRNVSVFNDGSCWIIGQNGDVEKFQFIGSSFQSEFYFTVSCSTICDALVFEKASKFYLFVLDNKSLKLFSILEDKLSEINSLNITFNASEICFDLFSRFLLLIGRGNQNVELISFQNFNSPKFIELPSLELNNNSVVLDAIFSDSIRENGEDTAQINILFYFSDSICNQELSYNFIQEINDVEITDLEPEFESGTVESALSTIEDDKQLPPLSTTSLSSDPFNLSFYRDEIKGIIRESIKETLIEVVHDALSQGLQAGLSQLNKDISSLVRTLIQSTESITFGSDSNQLPPSSNMQGVRNLISEGKFGLALKKSVEIDNARLLLEICQKVSDPFSILDEEQFSQFTLSQLFRLLSLEIEEDTEVKLDWLQEILIQIDLDTAIIESPNILDQVDTLFSQLKSLLNDSLVDGNLQKKMKTVMRLLRKFQMN